MVKKAVMDEGAFMCSICGAIVHEDANVCYQCNAPLEGSFKAVICAACGSIVASDRELCSVCGVEIRSTGGPRRVPVLDKDILGIVDEIKSESPSPAVSRKVETVVPTGMPGGDTTMELVDGLKEMNRVWDQIEGAAVKRDFAKVTELLEKGGATLDNLQSIPMRLDLVMQAKSAKAPEGAGASEELRKKQEYVDRRMEELRKQIEELEREKVRVRERTQVMDAREKSLGDREKSVGEREGKSGAPAVRGDAVVRASKMAKQILAYNQTLKSAEALKNVAALMKLVQEMEASIAGIDTSALAGGAPAVASDPAADAKIAEREVEVKRARADLELRERTLAAEKERLAAKEDELRESERRGGEEGAGVRRALEERDHELTASKGELERLQGMLSEMRGLQDARQKSKETEELLESELKARVSQVRALEERLAEAGSLKDADRSRLEGESQSLRQELGFAKERHARINDELESAQAELMKARARSESAAGAGGRASEKNEALIAEMRAKLSAMSAAVGVPDGAEADVATMRARLSPLDEAEMVKVLKALDNLLGRLPESEIDGFANSVVFPLYEKLTERYGI